MKYKAKESFYNPLTASYVKKGEIVEINTDKANTFNRYLVEVKQEEILADETVKDKAKAKAEAEEKAKAEEEAKAKAKAKEENPRVKKISLSTGKEVNKNKK